MLKASSMDGPTDRKAYVLTGPTSGIGRATALELTKHGTLVLVGRDAKRLREVQETIERRGQHAALVVCDLSDMRSVQGAAAEIVALQLPIAGLLNNAGIQQPRPTKTAQGWDGTFATNHLGAFLLTEPLIPHLSNGTNVLFVASGVEDPERAPAVTAGFRGGRYISAEASARGEWKPGGSAIPGGDAYATSKQCALATAIEFARENPPLHINAVEPGFTPVTNLGRDSSASIRFVLKYILPLFAPFIKYWSTPARAARVITKILTSTSGQSGLYYDDGGRPMTSSKLVRDPAFTSRVVAETRALLSTIKNESPVARLGRRLTGDEQP
jgi:NAD(P)-dependent dehydrogenase (short-subunit alcohol dehydrogenase family)